MVSNRNILKAVVEKRRNYKKKVRKKFWDWQVLMIQKLIQ